VTEERAAGDVLRLKRWEGRRMEEWSGAKETDGKQPRMS
jgi:hypothetical protein